MATELSALTAWTFISECEVPSDVQNMLVEGEAPWAAYKTIRDTAIITNKRIIIRDAQGLTGKKVEAYTIPFSSIVMYSTENAGTLDFNSELEMWLKHGHVKINLKKGIDIRRLDFLIASALLK